MRQKSKLKLCPYFKERCKGKDCMIYHEKFEKCGEELQAWNTYALKEATIGLIEKMEELMNR